MSNVYFLLNLLEGSDRCAGESSGLIRTAMQLLTQLLALSPEAELTEQTAKHTLKSYALPLILVIFFRIVFEKIGSKMLVFLRFREVLDGLERSGRPVGRIST